MERPAGLDHLRRDGRTLAEVAAASPGAPVAGCPGWTVADLATHTGAVHRWATAIVEGRAQERVSRRDLPPAPAQPEEVGPWFREGLDRLVAALEATDPATPLWTFGPDRTAAFWLRRMVQETAVHRWDAEAAAGTPAPLDPALAADGVDEYLGVFVANLGAPPGAGRLHLRAEDADRSWTAPIGDDGQEASATGSASDVLLFLWGRVEPGVLDASGDTALLRRWQETVRL